MRIITDNLFFILPIAFILIVAITNGLRTGKFLKFFVAGINLSALLFLLCGIFFFLKSQYFSTNRSTLNTNKAETSEFYNPRYLSKAAFHTDDTEFFDNAYVFLDFSGSIKSEELLKRINSIETTIKKIPNRRLYYFGSCISELGATDSPTIAKIDEIQKSICENSYKLSSYTDIFSLLDYSASLLESIADDRTLFLYITDDEHSTAKKEINFSAKLNDLKVKLKKYKDKGVVFQLIKIPGKKINTVMSSDVMKDIFFVDEIKEDAFDTRMRQIFEERLIKEDLFPIKIEDNNSNNKIVFHYSNFDPLNQGKTDIKINILNEYRTFFPLVRIDSIHGDNWKAIPEKTEVGQPCFDLSADQLQKKLTVNIESKIKLKFFNSSNNEQIKTFYTLFVPGSQQFNVSQYFIGNPEFKTTEENSTEKGALYANYFSLANDTLTYRPTPWVLVIYSILLFLLAKILSLMIKPTLKGRRINIKRTDISGYNISEKISTDIKKKIINDVSELPAFVFEVKKVKRNRMNIFLQPPDNIWFQSLNFSLPGKNRQMKAKILVGKKWNKTVSEHIFNIQ